MAFNLDSVKKVQALGVLNLNVSSRIVSKREREKLERVSHTIRWVSWSVDDFHKNLKLSNVGISPQNELDYDIVSVADLEKTFGKKT